MSKEVENYRKLKELILNTGASVFGVAALNEELKRSFLMPYEVVASLNYGISFGVALSKKILSTLTDGPNQLYYFHYQRTNVLIDSIALQITAIIQKEGYDALPIPASQIADWENQRGHLSHRKIAYNAGLGWWGKNNLIINPTYGAAVRYGTVLTDLPLVADTPLPETQNCGSCSRCVELCPAGAIKNDFFDEDLCKEKLKEFTRTLKIGQMICGVCVKACLVKVGGKCDV